MCHIYPDVVTGGGCNRLAGTSRIKCGRITKSIKSQASTIGAPHGLYSLNFKTCGEKFEYQYTRQLTNFG